MTTMPVTLDHVEIQNLLARLARATDVGTIAEYLENFTDDAVMLLPGQPPRVGSDAHRAAAESSREAGRLGPGSHTSHYVTTIEVQVDGDAATSEASFIFVATAGGGPVIRSVGRYHDVVRRTPSGWRLSQRTIEPG